MAKVIALPQLMDGPLAIPLSDGALLRLVPCRESPYVFLTLHGPRGGDAGGVKLHADRARVLGSWLQRLAAALDGRALDGLLDVDAVGTTLAGLAVPKFADWCVLDLVGRTGTVRRITVAHADPSKERAARALREYPPDPNGAHLRARALRTGEPTVERDVSDTHLVAAARDADHLAIIRSLGCRSAMAVPLMRRRRVIGLMTFATAESGRRYDETHLPAALAFARHAGFAVDNALAYRRARRALSPPVPSSRRPGSTSR